jgi:hypothetical protein
MHHLVQRIYKHTALLLASLIIICGCLFGNKLITDFLWREFTKDNTMFFNSVLNNITSTDKYASQILKGSLLSWSTVLESDKSLSLQKLKKMKNDFGISRLAIINADGYGPNNLDTDSELEHAKQLDEKYKDNDEYFSIFKSTCEAYRDLQQANWNNVPIITPMILSTMRQIPVKWAIMFDKTIKKYLYAEYSRDFFTTQLQKVAIEHGNIDFLSINDPAGGIIFSFGQQRNNTTTCKSAESAKCIINNSKDMTIYAPFGQIFNGNMESCFLSKIKHSLNSAGEYFYVLNIEFSKDNINKKIAFVQLRFCSAAAMLIVIAYFTINFFRTKQQHRLDMIMQARQIHHNISVPMQNLENTLTNIANNKNYDSSKITQMLANSVNFIRGSIADLYYLNNNNFHIKNATKKVEMLLPIVTSIVCSSEIPVNDSVSLVLHESDDWNMLVKIDSIAVRRALLNLTKNALESIVNSGLVEITLSKQDNFAIITIKDSGKGLTKELINDLMNGTLRGNNINGKGLGFKYAHDVIKKMGGDIAIKSDIKYGTTQIITLPLTNEKPVWFIDRININQYKTIVFLTNSNNINWQAALPKIHVLQYNDVLIAEKYIQSQHVDTFFIIDFDLHHSILNGIDIIVKYQLQHCSLLATSEYFDYDSNKEKSEEFGIKILPQSMLKKFLA